MDIKAIIKADIRALRSLVLIASFLIINKLKIFSFTRGALLLALFRI